MTWHGEKWPPSGAGRPGQRRAAARGGLSSFSPPPLALPALPAADPRLVSRERWGGGAGGQVGEGWELKLEREGEASMQPEKLLYQRGVLWNKQIQRGGRTSVPALIRPVPSLPIRAGGLVHAGGKKTAGLHLRSAS